MNKTYRLVVALPLFFLAGCASPSPAVAGGLDEAIVAAQAIQDARARQSAEENRLIAEATVAPHLHMQGMVRQEAQTALEVQTRINGVQNLDPIFLATLQKLQQGKMDVLAGQLGVRGLYGDDPREEALPRFRDFSEIFVGEFNPALNAVMNAREVCLSKAVVDSATATIMKQVEMVRNLRVYSQQNLVDDVNEALAQQVSVLASLQGFLALEDAMRFDMGQTRVYANLLDAISRSGAYNGELRRDARFTCLPKTTVASGVVMLTEQAEKILGSLLPNN